MKNKTKNGRMIIFFALGIFLSLSILNFVSAETNPCDPTIQLVSQDPSPAVPNDYVKVIFEVTNLGNCDGLTLKLNQEYPFSLDSNSSDTQTIETNPYAPDYRAVWTIPYKIRIDGDAFDGDYNLKLRYHEGASESLSDYVEQGFDISIKDSRTEFDAVIQESSGNDISIAIANIGKYTANSVVVRIPEQHSFAASGTTGQMAGNLESGDYTIVGFTITQKMQTPGNMTRGSIPTNQDQKSSQLQFDVYYTDNIGERRVVNMELPLSLGNSSVSMSGFSGRVKSSSSWYSSWITWIIVLVIIILGHIFYKKNPQKIKIWKYRLRNIFNKKKDMNQTPNWISNSKNKEKSK
jgi:hypothetical protein